MDGIILKVKPTIELTDEQFFQLCQDNRDLKFERNANGDLIILSPTGGETVLPVFFLYLERIW